ncbi:DUF1194 domain-containing protein [Paracraurococcus ruber]|uniref:DUF1194 domain-containing protein n=1 Tax=Paracraurococcus ruber TaxID=77675 RepID=A0ABS1D502_9PROT|nr:DUF1194 domain-containing protein [Paracraurococcus ruber]MBK1661342.1 hypothetical protein [Paracraurococcus ruber]TDG27394.1 DUF1194 domain-containing protein [Paracraurococcus ruber]
MFRRSLLGAALAMPALLRNQAARATTPVDVELVLAVDVSRSVDPEEQELQFTGYENAFRDPRLIEGIMGGPVGSIACMMFTWSDWHIQTVVVPWTKLDGPKTAGAFADAIAAAPRRTWLYTSISGAMDFAAKQFGQGFEGTRKVVDISGDGVNNSGRPVAEAREEALAQGIVLNGLAVLDKQPSPFSQASGLPPLDEYYRDEVIGGPGAFLVVAEGFTAFEAAVRRKIIREIAAVPAPGARVERFA